MANKKDTLTCGYCGQWARRTLKDGGWWLVPQFYMLESGTALCKKCMEVERRRRQFEEVKLWMARQAGIAVVVK